MPSLFNPNGTVPQATAPGLTQIASSLNTTPIQITTVAPHGFNDGDTVFVEGHNQNNANGRWQIARTGASTFNLIGSSGGGGGGSTSGYVSDYSINPVTTVPSSGDPRQVAGFNAALENTADMVPFLNERVGAYRQFAMTRLAYSDARQAAAFSTFTLTTNATWYHLTGAQWPYVNATSIPFNLGWHDILMLDFVCRATFSAGVYNDLAFGVSFDSGSTWTVIPGSVLEYGASERNVLPRLCAMFIVSDLIGANAPNNAVFGIMGNTDNNGTVYTLYPTYHMTVQHFRNNYAAVQ